MNRVPKDHICACPHDDPALEVMSKRQGPHHVGVRFWDEGIPLYRKADILLDGQIVYGVFEAVLGDQGTVWRYRGIPSSAGRNRHQCATCNIGICTEKLTGRVEFRVRARDRE
jgi:hypothetical protein